MAENPLSLDDIKEILKIQHGDENFEIIETHMKPFSDNVSGFTTTHNKLKIITKYNDELITSNYFVKYLNNKESAFFELLMSGNCFEKEIFAYTKFINRANKLMNDCNLEFMPKFYFASKDVIVLQDLTLNDYKMINADDVNEEYVLSALRSLAKLHTITFLIEERESIERKVKYKLIDDYRNELKEGMFRNYDPNDFCYKMITCGFDAVIELSNHLMVYSKQFQEIFQKTNDFMLNMFANDGAKKYRCVFSHGDVWLNNLLYKRNVIENEDDEKLKCTFVDYQFVRYAPPAHDVTFLLYQICDEKLFKKSYLNFKEKYYVYLKSELEKYKLNVNEILSKREYDETCRIYLTFSKIIKTYFLTFSAASESSRKEIFENYTKMYNFLYVGRANTCKYFMENEENYRQILLKSIQDIWDDIKNEDAS